METDAREKLLGAALKLFSQNGFKGTSTRELVKEAGVNISAITYYFGSKEGLYKAVIDNIADIVRCEMQDAMRDAVSSNKTSREILFALAYRMVSFFCGDKISPQMMGIFIKEQTIQGYGFKTMYEQIVEPVHKLFTEVFSEATGLDKESREAAMSAHSVLGQIIIFKTHRSIICKRIGQSELGNNDVIYIQKTIRKHIEAIIESYKGE